MREKFRGLTLITLIGFVLLLLGVIFVVLGYGGDMKGFMANLSVELLSMGITILVIDTLYRRQEKRHEEEKEKLMLISRLGSTENSIAKQAARDLREQNWLKFPKILLSNANLENAELYGFDLSGANLTCTNLKGAYLSQAILDGVFAHETDFKSAVFHNTKLRNAEFRSMRGQYLLRDADLKMVDLTGTTFKGFASGDYSEDEQHLQLQEAKRMRLATMPNGMKYDGRYNLQGDYADALAQK